MKRLCTLATLSVLLLMATESLCSAVLISVELPTIEIKKTWHQLGMPTYELIGNTAIAEVEESLTGSLKQKGYQIEIIDRQPDLSKYVIVSNYDKTQEIKEITIWQNERTALVKSESKGILNYKNMKHSIRPINKKPLVDRFWSQVLTTNISSRSLPYDSIVQGLVEKVNTDSIASYISRLVAFYTRCTLTDSGYAASQWIYDKYISWGYTATLDTFYVNTTYLGYTHIGYDRNVIGSMMGAYSPAREIIIGGHYDSYGTPDPNSVAPGADDNATGMAVALEAARVCQGTDFESTIKFFGFGCEEFGMFGSTHYANEAYDQNTDIVAVLNNDMLGWGSDGYIVAGTDWLAELLSLVVFYYVPSLVAGTDNPPLCDAQPFYNLGYPAIITSEKDGLDNEYINSVHDSIIYLLPPLYTANIKAQIAAMAVLGRMPGPVNDAVIKDVGDGSHLFVQWSSSPELDVQGYKLLIGRQSGLYSDSIYVPGRLSGGDTLESLMTDSMYYISIWAVDSVGYSSCFAAEVTGMPKIEPSVPSGLTATSVDSGIEIHWLSNTEPDLAGYKLYCKIDAGSYDSLYIGVDTSCLNQPLLGSSKYYYKVQAFDTDGNYSSFSDSVYGRPITLDQGILLVDETNNWTTGSFPRDAQQDSFYNYILASYKYEPYEYGSSLQKPILADFGPYSTVAWLADDNTTLLAPGAVNDLRSYLDYGGKLWFAGWKPSGDIRGSASYPVDPSAGDILYDHFKMSHIELSGTADSFKTAVGLRGYPDIMVDTLKYPSTVWGKTFRYIEAFTPLAGADTIYVMDMKNNGSTFEGKACAVRDSGKTVFFGFPMYYMDKDQARLAAQQVMAEFGEVPLGISGGTDNRGQITGVRLFQNAPNPFKNQTAISYQLPNAGQVKLNIYNIAGQLVKTLINGEHQSGSYTVKWDGRDDNGLKVSNGVYVYKLEAAGIKGTKKMLLLR